MAGRGRPAITDGTKKALVVSFKVDSHIEHELNTVIDAERDRAGEQSLGQVARDMLETALRERARRLKRPYGAMVPGYTKRPGRAPAEGSGRGSTKRPGRAQGSKRAGQAK